MFSKGLSSDQVIRQCYICCMVYIVNVTTQVRTLERDIKERQVRYELPDGSKRSYRVRKVLGSAAEQRIPDTNVTVFEHFKDQYRMILKYPNMPCLWLGSKEKAIYVPVEFCRMSSKPLPRGKATYGHKMEEHISKIFAQQGKGERADAGSSSQGFRENRKASDVVELSKCPVCQDNCFTDPVVTDCGHLICWPCLNRNRSTAEHNKDNCPMCRHTYGSVMSVNMKGEASILSSEIFMLLKGVDP